MERAVRSRTIFIPRTDVAGPRSCSLKWEASSAFTDWSAALAFEASRRSSTCMGIMMRTSSRRYRVVAICTFEADPRQYGVEFEGPYTRSLLDTI
jgi:hypothetical protein